MGFLEIFWRRADGSWLGMGWEIFMLGTFFLKVGFSGGLDSLVCCVADYWK